MVAASRHNRLVIFSICPRANAWNRKDPSLNASCVTTGASQKHSWNRSVAAGPSPAAVCSSRKRARCSCGYQLRPHYYGVLDILQEEMTCWRQASSAMSSSILLGRTTSCFALELLLQTSAIRRQQPLDMQSARCKAMVHMPLQFQARTTE